MAKQDGINNNSNNNNQSNNKGKRKRYSGNSQQQQQHGQKNHQQEKRGGPGVLLTCETFRELKCQREGIDVLQYYMGKEKIDNTNTNQTTTKDDDTNDGSNDGKRKSDGEDDTSNNKSDKLDLDQELEQLRQQNSKGKNSGSNQQHTDLCVYDTGCRGTVLLLCTLPDCQLIPPITKGNGHVAAEDEAAGDNGTLDDVAAEDEAAGDTSALDDKKKRKQDLEKNDDFKESETNQDGGGVVAKSCIDTPSSRQEQTSIDEANNDKVIDTKDAVRECVDKGSGWDPVTVIETILKGTTDGTNREAPSSRFVTRMIPLQSTCFASMDEICETTKFLLQRFLYKMEKKQEKDKQTTTTFGIYVKRRSCGHLTTNAIIQSLGAQVAALAPSWKVDLTAPTVKIWVEICRTTAGVSIFRVNSTLSAKTKFNVVDLRAASAAAQEDPVE